MNDKYQERDIREGRPGKPYGNDGWLTPEGKISPCYRFEDALEDERQTMEIDQFAASIAHEIYNAECFAFAGEGPKPHSERCQAAARIIIQAIRKVCDPLQAEIDRLRAHTEAVLSWYVAHDRYHKASEVYNQRLALVRIERERGNWSMNVDHEYRALNDSQKAALAADAYLYRALDEREWVD